MATKRELPIRFADWLTDEFNDFTNRFGDFVAPAWFSDREVQFVPPLEFEERDKDFLVKVELPGMAAKDVQITLDQDMLLIKGEKTESKEEKKKNFHRTERRYGAFQRTLRLPGADAEKVNATFENGLLTIVIGKTVEAKSREIKINVK